MEAMAPKKRKITASMHLVCGNCRSWIQFESSGCGKTWAETRGKGFEFTCKGCTEVTALVKEVEGLKQMVEDIMEKVAGLRVEDKGEETGSSVTMTGVIQDGEVQARDEAAGITRTEETITGVEDEGEIRTEEKITGVEDEGEIRTEEAITGVEDEGEIRTEETITGVEDEGEIRTEEMITGDEGEIRTEERKEICSGATLMATHAYTRNPESPIGKEIDLQQWETLVFKGLHAENEHWRLVEDTHGQVGYAPAAFLVVILDTTAGEEENDATKKGQVNSTEENRIGGRIGQEGERRKSYSAAVIDGKKRKDTIYVGDSIMRKTDSRLSKGEDVVVCLPGARIEHVTERVEKIMGRGNGGTILVHVGTNNADKEGTTAIVEKYRDLLKKTKQARVGQIIISGILPVFGNRIQGYRNSKRMAVNGMVERLCKDEDVGYVDLWDSFVGREDMYRRDGLHLSGKGAAVFAEGLSGAVASGLGKVRYLN